MASQRLKFGFAILLGLLLLLGAGAYWRIMPAPNPPYAAADFNNPANWVCLPGRDDSCGGTLDTTDIAADGTTRQTPASPAKDPPADCFYVYPTASRARTANAPLELSEEVAWVTRQQFARFATACRPFAPLYRQNTLRGLAASMLGLGTPDYERAYADVRAAWAVYLARYNQGRPVVLIGHSQGSRMLKRLAQAEIDGKPLQARVLSVMLLGNTVSVAAGRDVGGDFHSMPLCHAPTQTGCVITYASFRATTPPPVGGRFGINPGPGLQVACTNPAALQGGPAVLHSVFPTQAPHTKPWANPPVPIETPFVTVSGLISGTCVRNENGAYLAISLNGHPGDRRRTDIDGDISMFGHVLKGWGLHLIDANLPQADLVDLVRSQTAAFHAGNPASPP